MKTNYSKVLAAALVAAGLTVMDVSVRAQDASSANSLSAPVKEILQLQQAKVGDDTIIAYIKNSGNSYELNADLIIHLRQEGLSDSVLTAMLQHARSSGTVGPSAPAPQPAAPAPAPATGSEQVSTVTVAPSTTYVQTVPAAPYYYAQPYPYYYPYYYPGYAYAPVSFSFGWVYGGGGCHYGYHGGCYHH